MEEEEDPSNEYVWGIQQWMPNGQVEPELLKQVQNSPDETMARDYFKAL